MATGRRNGAVSCATNVTNMGRAACVLRARIRASIYVIAGATPHTFKQLTKPEPKKADQTDVGDTDGNTQSIKER